MAKTKKDVQIPQAHSYTFFVSVLEAVKKGKKGQGALAKHLDVKPRTISYYTQLGRWLGWMEKDVLTAEGEKFLASNAKTRKETFKALLLKESWIKKAVAKPDDLIASFDAEIAKVSSIADATRGRRAKAMASLWEDIEELGGKKKTTKKKTKKAAPKKKTAKSKTSKKATSKKAPAKKATTKKSTKKAAPKKAAEKSSVRRTPELGHKPSPFENEKDNTKIMWVGEKVVWPVFKLAGKFLDILR